MLLLVLVLIAAWSGWKKGFLQGFIELVAWLGSLLLAFKGYEALSANLKAWWPSIGAWASPVSFLVILLFARILVALIGGKLVDSLSTRVRPAAIDKLLGIIPGLVTGFLYAIIASAMLLSLSSYASIAESARGSLLVQELEPKIAWANEKVTPVFEDVLKENAAERTYHPASNETVSLPYKVTSGKTRPDLETKMLELVNAERAKEGLQPLEADPEMTRVARAHAADMFARGYFSHYTPEKTDPFDRMKAQKVRFRTAGENLALGQTLKLCHEGLMNSPGHRANILQPAFGRLGIGIVDGGIYGLMIAQEFRN